MPNTPNTVFFVESQQAGCRYLTKAPIRHLNLSVIPSVISVTSGILTSDANIAICTLAFIAFCFAGEPSASGMISGICCCDNIGALRSLSRL